MMKKWIAMLLIAVLALTGGAFAEQAPDETALDAMISGDWQINDNIMAGMTITKNEGEGWALQIATAYPGVYVYQADLFYDGEQDEFVYTGGKVYRSEITDTPEVVLGEQITDDASGSLKAVTTDGGAILLNWHNDLSPDEDALFYRADYAENLEDGAQMAEGADSDWYMAVLDDSGITAQFPYHAFVDVNGDGVPVLIVSTTEEAFISAEDQARVYVYANGEPKQVMEVGQAGGEKFYCNADEHTLTHYSRLSGESHLDIFQVKDGALETVTTVDEYQPNHGPNGDNADPIYLQDGAEITEAEFNALNDRYAAEDQVVTYEKLAD